MKTALLALLMTTVTGAASAAITITSTSSGTDTYLGPSTFRLAVGGLAEHVLYTYSPAGAPLTVPANFNSFYTSSNGARFIGKTSANVPFSVDVPLTYGSSSTPSAGEIPASSFPTGTFTLNSVQIRIVYDYFDTSLLPAQTTYDITKFALGITINNDAVNGLDVNLVNMIASGLTIN